MLLGLITLIPFAFKRSRSFTANENKMLQNVYLYDSFYTWCYFHVYYIRSLSLFLFFFLIFLLFPFHCCVRFMYFFSIWLLVFSFILLLFLYTSITIYMYNNMLKESNTILLYHITIYFRSFYGFNRHQQGHRWE